MMKVSEVPTAGMVTKVGRNVPSIEPIVFAASSRPTALPASAAFFIVYLASDGVVVPSRNSGKTKTTRHAASAAQMR